MAGTPKVSVICVTKRGPRALEILAESLNRQSLKDFEVIVADELFNSSTEDFSELLHEEHRVIHFHPRAKVHGDVWNLNKAYNDCIEKSTGELLVFLQDFIWIPNDGLQRFWDFYQEHPNALITGVGHKAERGLHGISEFDRRASSVEPITYTGWELNWAACPRKVMPQFHEGMDRYYGGENQYVAKYAMHMGAECLIDRTNFCIGYSQKECGGRPENWEPMHCNKEGRLAAFLELLERTLPPLRSY